MGDDGRVLPYVSYNSLKFYIIDFGSWSHNGLYAGVNSEDLYLQKEVVTEWPLYPTQPEGPEKPSSQATAPQPSENEERTYEC